MAAKFVLKKGTTGKFRFNLLATNGQVIATSEAYESKAAALRGIESVRKNASGATLDDQTDGTAGKTAAKKTAKKTAARKTVARKSAAKLTSSGVAGPTLSL